MIDTFHGSHLRVVLLLLSGAFRGGRVTGPGVVGLAACVPAAAVVAATGVVIVVAVVDVSGGDVLYTVQEVAARLQVSPRWLADQCRADKIEHVHVARQRRFTAAQVEALIARHTVRPIADLKLDATRQRVLRLLERKQAGVARHPRQMGRS